MNIDDLHLAEGTFLGGMPGLQTNEPTPTKPLVLRSDFAGVVVAVGSKVAGESLQVGQRVCGLNARMLGHAGTWADYTVSTAKDHVVPIPDHVSFVESAHVPAWPSILALSPQTRCPTCKESPATLDPTATTTPAKSLPNTRGLVGVGSFVCKPGIPPRNVPSARCKSSIFMEEALTLMRTWSGLRLEGS